MHGNNKLKFCLVTTFYPPYNFGGDGIYAHRLGMNSQAPLSSVESGYYCDRVLIPTLPTFHSPAVQSQIRWHVVILLGSMTFLPFTGFASNSGWGMWILRGCLLNP